MAATLEHNSFFAQMIHRCGFCLHLLGKQLLLGSVTVELNQFVFMWTSDCFKINCEPVLYQNVLIIHVYNLKV